MSDFVGRHRTLLAFVSEVYDHVELLQGYASPDPSITIPFLDDMQWTVAMELLDAILANRGLMRAARAAIDGGISSDCLLATRAVRLSSMGRGTLASEEYIEHRHGELEEESGHPFGGSLRLTWLTNA